MSDLKVGDKIRILEDWHNSARVYVGDILRVTEVQEGWRVFLTEAPRLKYLNTEWNFQYEDEGTGWEKYEGEK